MADIPPALVTICERVAQHGIEALSEEEMMDIFIIGQESGLPYEDYANVESYCEFVIEQVAMHMSLQQPKPLPVRPSANKRPKKVDENCHFEESDDEPCTERDDAGNLIDEITYAPIQNLARVRCGKRQSCYDISTLKHLLDTNPTDPVTRQPFTREFQDEIIRRHRASSSGSLSNSPSFGGGQEDNDEREVSDAIRRLDKLYDNVERSIEYAEALSPDQKRAFQAKIVNSKAVYQEILRQEGIDVATRVFIIFGDEEQPGEATLDEQAVRQEVYDLIY